MNTPSFVTTIASTVCRTLRCGNLLSRTRRYGTGLCLTVFLSAIAASGGAYGSGFQQQMQDTFNAMATTTNPQFVRSATRGVITGGGMSVRNKVSYLDSFYSIQLPRIRAGCGGWDLYAGAFSFISAEQIVEMMRNIVANAAAYAFQLAISTISDKIASLMNLNWKDHISIMLNGLNSCEMGKMLVDGAINGGWKTQADQGAANQAAASGTSEDNQAARNIGKSQSPAASQASSPDPEVQKLLKGNHLWNAMKAMGESVWSPYGGVDFMQDVMSLVGTRIMCAPGQQGCPGSNGGGSGQTEMEVMERGPVMDLTALVKGRMARDSVERYVCNDTSRCFNPKVTEIKNFIGMEERIRTRLLGAPNESNGGLIGKIVNQVPYSDEDKAMLEAGRGLVVAIQNIALRDGDTAARDFAERYIEIHAAELTAELVRQSLLRVAQAASTYEGGREAKTQRMVYAALETLNAQLRSYQTATNVTSSWLGHYQDLKEEKTDATMPELHDVTAY